MPALLCNCALASWLQLGQRLAALNRPATMDDLSVAVQAIYAERPGQFFAVRATNRPHVTKKLDPRGTLRAAIRQGLPEEGHDDLSD